jgi:hypothetical protein
MFAVFIAFVTASTGKADLSLKGSVNVSAKHLSPLSDKVDSDDCYDAYKALADRYVTETAGVKKRITSGGIKKNHLKKNEINPLSTPETSALITAFGAECLATADGDDCKALLILLAAITETTPTVPNKKLFATTCHVDEPSGGGDDSGDNGLFSFRTNKIMMLFSLVSTIFYFLY